MRSQKVKSLSRFTRTLTCLRRVSIFCLCTGFLGCSAQRELVPVTSERFVEQVRGICFDVDGSGTFIHRKLEQNFDFESGFDRDGLSPGENPTTWRFATEVPLRGEELFQIDRKGERRFLFSGGFNNLIWEAYEDYMTKTRGSKKKDLKKFMFQMAKFLFELQKLSSLSERDLKVLFDSSCSGEPRKFCQIPYGKLILFLDSETLSLRNSVQEKWHFHWNLKKLKEFYVNHSLVLKRGVSSATDLFRLHFKFDDFERCQLDT